MVLLVGYLCFSNVTKSYNGMCENIKDLGFSVFISFVLIFEHCYFLDNCRLLNKMRPDMSTKKCLNNSPSFSSQ